MDKQDYMALVLYYGRSKFFHSMQKAALDGLAKHPAQVEFRLFNGIALALGNRVQEAIRELTPIKNEQELNLAAVLALIYSHRHCKVIDKDALAALEDKLKDERRNLSARSAYFAAIFLFLTDKIDKARDYADKALKIDDSLDGAIILKVWTQLAQNTKANGNARTALEKILNRSKNIDASLAEVKLYQRNHDFENAISVLDKLSVRYPELIIPLTEKMETQLAAWEWEHAFESAHRIINLEPTNISALRVRALVLICKEGNIKAGVATLQQLLSAAEAVEAGNSRIIMQICVLFSRLCSRNKDVLDVTHTYVTKLIRLDFDDVEHMTELGYHNILSGYRKDAEKCFRSATKIDSNYFLALCGLTLCQIMDRGSTEQARQQIEFLGDLKGVDRSPLLLFLISKITENTVKAISFLIEATEMHLNRLAMYSFGAEYLRHLDPDFLLQIVADIMRLSSGHIQANLGLNASKETFQVHFNHCNIILDTITKACPAHLHATYMKAKIDFLCGELSSAIFALNRIIGGIDETFTDAYLLLAQIQIQQQQYAKALQSLEICLSHNFSVRENPLYRMLTGIVQKNQQQYTEAQKSLQCALHLIGSSFGNENGDRKVLKSSEKSAKVTGFDTASGFSLTDKATLYLELIDVYNRLAERTEEDSESERLLHVALEEFANTPLEGRLVLAHAEIMVQKGNISKAIDLLTEIHPSQLYYSQAKTQLAYIYLHYKKDRVTFAKCFKQLVDDCPKPENYLMLGEAYMSIQEPDLAVEAYKKALEINPKDSLVASKLGRAYIKTHQYTAAVKYYKEALNNPHYSELKLDLAELYLKLKQYQNAADVLTNSNDAKINTSDMEGIQFYTKQLLLLARIQEKFGNINLSLQTLKEARDNQLRMFKRILVEKPGILIEQNKMVSRICFLMAQQHITLRENEEAITYFKECLKYTPSDMEVLVSLARLYMQAGSMDLCRDVCAQILHMDSNNEAASVMMADMSFRNMDFKSAVYHFSQLLISQPCYWTALARLIEITRRSGTLQEVVSFMQRAEQAAPNVSQAAGLSYCKGLYEWYSGNPNGALKYFNAARKDYEWGQQAIFNMINICINPDGELPNPSDSLETLDVGSEFSESRIIALRTAERLLQELRPQPGVLSHEALNHRMLRNFLQLATKQKLKIESALQDFTDLVSREGNQHLAGPILGVATALIQLKQTQRAKNQLKRITRATWNFEEAEYLERCWLLLADIYIHANKLDTADSYVRRVLEHNKSCIKAYEFAGIIAEKNQAYREAAKFYQNAWIHGRLSKPDMGYKLAYNHMKTKKYADAVDVCQQVLKLHPDYIVIKKDILDKCRNYLRA